MKEKYHRAFMKMAEAFAETSEAVRLKVGCVLVKDGNIISLRVNGMPPGWPTEVCEDKVYYPDAGNWLSPEEIEEKFLEDDLGFYKLITKPECRHAEIAALEKMWNSHTTTQGSEMYITHSPCLNCCIKIKTAGITKVYYKEPYRCDKGLTELRKAGIVVTQI
jgi:dCMP deaminase